jgi:hypothetical protein
MTALACILLPVAAGWTQDSDRDRNARDFAVAGKIGFNMTLEGFKKEYPLAARGKSTDEKIGYYHFVVNSVPNTDGVIVWFFDGKLLEVAPVYTEDRIRNLGGAEAFVKALKNKFGNNDGFRDDKVKDEVTVIWRMPNVNRVVILRSARNVVTLHVGDSALQKRLDDRRAKEADLGF